VNADARNFEALAIHERDNVAVALEDVAQGAQVRVSRAGRIETLIAGDAISLGHKFALEAIAAGAPVVKYGEIIGAASAPIAKGAHVHVHNLASRRARK